MAQKQMPRIPSGRDAGPGARGFEERWPLGIEQPALSRFGSAYRVDSNRNQARRSASSIQTSIRLVVA